MAETTSDILVDRLIDWGVDTSFGLPGAGINGIMGNKVAILAGQGQRVRELV